MKYELICPEQMTHNLKLGANLLRAGDLRNQTRLRFYLTHDDKLGVNYPRQVIRGIEPS